MMSLKVLHRIYFGFDEKPDQYQEYLETWRHQLPDYEIKLWSKDNLPLDLNEYTRALTSEKDYAFLGDYFRWWVLREFGGVYLDADIEIINGKKFNTLIEELESAQDYDALIGIDTDDGCYTAHSMAACKNSELVNFMCGFYENLGVLRSRRKQFFVAPLVVPLFFQDENPLNLAEGRFVGCMEPTIFRRVKIYPKDFFSPLSYSGDYFWLKDCTPNTVICHHYGCSWHTPDSLYFPRGNQIRQQRVMMKDYIKNNSVDQSKQSSILIRLLKKIKRMLKVVPHAVKIILKA